MKQILLLLSIVILSNNLIFAQKSISKDDFEHLVDYANCKYVKSFIEKNDAGKPYFKDYYEKKVKPELEKVKLGSFQTILKYEKIIELLSNNIPASKLAKKFNERKFKYAEFQDNESLCKSLITSGWNNVDLSRTASNIQNEIIAKYSSIKDKNDIQISESDVVRAQTIQTTSQVEELQLKLNQLQEQYENLRNDTKIMEFKDSLSKLKLIIYLGLGLMIFLFLVVFLLLKKLASRDYIIKHVIDSKRIEEKFSFRENISSDQGFNKRTEGYKLSEADINMIVDRVLEGKKINESENRKQFNTTTTEKTETSKTSYKYLKGKSGKIFNRSENTPENSFFRLFNEKEESAQFEFFGDEGEAIAKRIFSEDICTIISGSYQNARAVITSKPGKIKRIGDQWEVFEPVEIKLI